jgi:flagellar protein FlgJ
MGFKPLDSGLTSDTRSLDALRGAAARDPKVAVREAAKQFESLFMHELLKSMRAATPTTGLLDNEATKLGTEMLDQQLSTKLTGLKGGLADAISRQLERQMGLTDAPGTPGVSNGEGSPPVSLNKPGTLTPFSDASRAAGVKSTASSARDTTPAHKSAPRAFVQQLQGAAQQAEQRTGIPAVFMIAQAAHETGWGRRDIRMSDGAPSNNLFGIKAGPDWKGPVAEVTTTEFINGVARKVTARFRAYADAAESFADYARLMMRSPRYQGVLANSRTPEGFAQGLQQAGYATDPQYASKLSRVIDTTLRLQRNSSA